MTVDAAGKGFSLPSGPASLCFDKEEFMKAGFEVDKFIVECRKRVPLETLRDDLGLYLKVVRSAMIELINKDYADFVNLSTNLVGMDKAITNLTTPLGQLKEEVLSVQTAMDMAIQAVEEKIRQQQEIMRKKAVLQRLMNITYSVEKIEKLLGIRSGSEGESSPGQLTGPLIERVATEFNKLQFYVTRSKGHPLVDKVKPRIATITTTLQYSLEGSFLSGLETGKTGMLRQCLRTYALIDKTQDAEDLFREHVVKPYMEDIITEDFLAQHNNDLTAMFEEALTFVPEKCSILSNITTGTSGGDIVRGYDFVVNAVFPEIVSSLEIRTSSIFAPGNPDAFHNKYKACMQFLDNFESQCASQASVKRLRQHPSYIALLGKWSLPVYFQIRFQDIATSFETSLSYGFSNSTALIRSMCPDFAIAKDLKCARSKASALAKEMSVAAKESLVARMKTGPFTISTDGSNDMEKGKLFPLVVRTVSDEGVKSEVLSVLELHDSATGKRIFECVSNIMQTKEIPWTNCLSLGSDNANVMIGKHKGVISLCTEKHPNMYLSGCTLHLVHIAAEKGAKVVPIDPGDILTNIYFYFNN
ncbi:conserved oligomeric Golgi complex subunit 2 [Plakobranchus ocellatus]|uniref:Conserved oligomeric Golgi complex subunit 2 n=1 Tax=Plakobranchus ocellatus TaxID=259542 RepID=A0AAV4CBZ2_9GAST|nr:conserved oligomeric Golgi complex subunit 2 [Plakobranchus ocellatus]